MSDPCYILLEDRGLIGLTGEDTREFLQGLISNDVHKVTPDQSLYAALLTPQGKFLFDFFLIETSDGLLIDCERNRLDDLTRKLSMYRMRSKVELTDRTSEFAVAAVIGTGVPEIFNVDDREGAATSFAGGYGYIDPRLAAMGGRVVTPRQDAANALREAGLGSADMADYERLRLTLGLPDGSRDMVVDKAVLLENGFAELHGVDWDKGCYMGQELTARTHYRGLVKKRLMPVRLKGPAPEPGTQIFSDGKDAGEIRSVQDDRGIALIRLQPFRDQAVFTAGDTTILPEKPDWAVFPEPE